MENHDQKINLYNRLVIAFVALGGTVWSSSLESHSFSRCCR
jgi:hypothetical protein